MKNILFIILILLITVGIKTDDSIIIEKVTDEQMQKLGWTNYYLEDLNYCIKKFEINTKERLCHFISQLSYESANGRYTQEIGNETYCKRYDGRTDLGNTQPGDGCKFKGAGYLLLTGRYNYQKFADFIGDKNIMKGVSYVSVKYPWTSAGFWWHNYDINSLIDKGTSIQRLRKIIGGGGLDSGIPAKQITKVYYKCKDIF